MDHIGAKSIHDFSLMLPSKELRAFAPSDLLYFELTKSDMTGHPGVWVQYYMFEWVPPYP